MLNFFIRSAWVLSFFLAIPSFAWEHHQTLLKAMLESSATLSRGYLSTEVKIPSLEEEKAEIKKIALKLGLNENKIPVYREKYPKVKTQALRVLLESDFVDEPDFGMDQDLPDSADPKHERSWMGGSQGPTSQGFRHMYFAGFEWSSPIDTFQIPLRAIGQAPDRYRLLKEASQEYLQQKNIFWGARLLLWSIHFLQDLHQPFHVTQVLNLRMLPWKSLFSGFVSRSTQSVANYHYAYEGLALEYVKDARVGAFYECVEVIKKTSPQAIEKVIERSRESAPALGVSLVALFGNELKSEKVDLPNHQGSVDYYALVHARAEEGVTERLAALTQTRKITCGLIQDTVLATWAEFDAVLGSNLHSSNTGK